MSEKETATPKDPNDRVGLLSEMAQIQRRNAEMAMTLYTWTGGKEGDPSFPEDLRAVALKTIEGVFNDLDAINVEICKLV